VSFLSPLHPVHVSLNTDERLSLAITAEEDTLTGTGVRTYDRANLRLTVNALADTAVLRMEQYWVGADPATDAPWAYVVSPDRWWRVAGSIPPGADITLRLTLDGRPTISGSLDLGLVQDAGGILFHEDSLVVLYRPDAHMPWSVLPDVTVNTIGAANDGYARLDVEGMMTGDYTFGWRKSPVAVNGPEDLPSIITVHPVPADGSITFDLRNAPPSGTLVIFDGGGREVMQLAAASIRVPMSVTEMPSGTYTVEWHYASGRTARTRFIVQH
jgi:hypothetical protein